MINLLVKVLAMVSIFSTNLEKRYLKRYGKVCHNNNLCVELYDTCECEQKNIFRQLAIKIGVYIWRLENLKYYLKNKLGIKTDYKKEQRKVGK